MSAFWPDELQVDPIGEWPGVMTSTRVRSNFSAPWKATLDLLDREVFMLGGKNVRLQVAIAPEQFRLDGRPRATAKALHPGVILTLESRFGPLSYPCDTFLSWQDNVRAIALALEALRKVDRYGVTKRGEQYRGFLALESTAVPAGFATAQDAWAYLMRIATGTGNAIRVENAEPGALRLALRRAQQKTHPDTGGDATAFQRVSLAEAKLREEGLL